MQESFTSRKPVGLSWEGGVAHFAFILDCHRVSKLLGVWMRWSRTSSAWFIVTREAGLPALACIAGEVQLGVPPPWDLLGLRRDEGGRWLWKNVGCVGKGLFLLQGEPANSLTFLGLNFQNLTPGFGWMGALDRHD